MIYGKNMKIQHNQEELIMDKKTANIMVVINVLSMSILTWFFSGIMDDNSQQYMELQDKYLDCKYDGNEVETPLDSS